MPRFRRGFAGLRASPARRATLPGLRQRALRVRRARAGRFLQNAQAALRSFSLVSADVHHPVVVHAAEPDHRRRAEHVQHQLSALFRPSCASSRQSLPGPVSRRDGDLARRARSGELRFDVTPMVIAPRFARELQRAQHVRSRRRWPSGRPPRRRSLTVSPARSRAALRGESSRLPTASSQRAPASGDHGLHQRGGTPNVGGHSAASSVASRPLVPAPT